MEKLIVLLVLAGTAAAFGTPVFDNGVLTYTVAADETETEANTFASYGTVTSVVKEGAGELPKLVKVDVTVDGVACKRYSTHYVREGLTILFK